MSSSFRYKQPFVTEEGSENEMSPTPQANDNGGNVNNAANDQSDAAMADQAANTNNDQPPAYEAPAQEGPAAARLTIVFKNQAGAETQFKLKNTTPMVKATDAYHATHGVTAGAYRFLFDGIRVLDAHTPKELEMEDGDVVDVFTEQLGGGNCAL